MSVPRAWLLSKFKQANTVHFLWPEHVRLSSWWKYQWWYAWRLPTWFQGRHFQGIQYIPRYRIPTTFPCILHGHLISILVQIVFKRDGKLYQVNQFWQIWLCNIIHWYGLKNSWNSIQEITTAIGFEDQNIILYIWCWKTTMKRTIPEASFWSSCVVFLENSEPM